jgi:hypothetical protein
MNIRNDIVLNTMNFLSLFRIIPPFLTAEIISQAMKNFCALLGV